MTKEELVYLTLRQLSESLKTSPENFRLEDHNSATTSASYNGPTIIWQYKVRLSEDRYVTDPLNSVRTVVVTFNRMAKQIQCLIYNREITSLNSALTPEAQAVVKFNYYLPLFFNRTYRQFIGLQKSLLKRKLLKEYMDYARRLNAIFPATHEEDIFK